jgi:3-oxoacyl-[acyl-carrier protein] reductase
MPSKKPENEGLAKKIAVVTGGTRGIGKAIAARLLEEGVSVAICGKRQKSVDSALSDLAPKDKVFGMVADVGSMDDVRQFSAAVQQRFGNIHILINNAGLAIFRSVAEMAPEEWAAMISVNLTGVYYCCHEFLPIITRAGGGDIVNISSLAGKNAFAGGAGYNASKFGLNGFSEALMLDHRNDGVRVSTIMPGSVDTEFGSGPAARRESAAGSPDRSVSGWKIAPEDIAEIVVSLLRMPVRTTISSVEVRPSRPPKKG